MTITMQPTMQLVTVEGVLSRRWMGVTDQGTPVDIFVRILRVSAMEDTDAFNRELMEVPPPIGDPIDLRRLL